MLKLYKNDYYGQRDLNRENAQKLHGDVIKYQASPKLYAELSARAEKAAKELQKERERNIALSGSVSKVRK